LATILKFKRGVNANVGTLTLQAGEPAFVTDTGKLYIGDGTNKILINPTYGTAATKDTGTASGNVPVLDSSGKLASSVIPSIAMTETYEVGSQAAMLALSVNVGDVAIRTDENKSYILAFEPASTLSNWIWLRTPTDAVLSVAGKTGAVTLTSSDVGLGNVTNESKATMFTNAALTGVPTAPTASTATNNTQIATTAYVKSQAYLTASDIASLTIDGGTF
jgi:hypothetical protein